jgi:FtsH-binding integral membrane protein
VYNRAALCAFVKSNLAPMNSLDVLLPLGLLVLAFLLKLFVDQSADVPRTIEALYSVPIDVVFLATSFAVAFTLSSPSGAGRGLLHVLGFIIAAVVVVFLWRRSRRLFDVTHYFWSAVVFVLNVGISASLLHRAVSLLSEVRQ